MKVKAFTLSAQQVAQAFDPAGPPHVSLVGLPAGYKVESVALQPGGLFRFLVSHETFPDLADGDEPPALQVNLAVHEEEAP